MGLPGRPPVFVRWMDRLYLAAMWAAGAAIVAMSLIVPWGVFTRYVLGTGSQWPEPIAILLMMVFTFVGAATAYRAGGHIAVALLTDRLPAACSPECRHLGDVDDRTARRSASARPGPADPRTWS